MNRLALRVVTLLQRLIIIVGLGAAGALIVLSCRASAGPLDTPLHLDRGLDGYRLQHGPLT